MAKNEPSMPDDVKTAPAIETSAEEQAAPAAPFDISDPGDVVVSFEKINELANKRKMAEREAAGLEEETSEAEAPEKKAARKGRPPKADKADTESKPEKAPKAADKKEAPAPESEKPP